jgi:hypothetical protein
MFRNTVPVLAAFAGLCALAPPASAQECVQSDPASSACLMVDPSWSPTPGSGGRRGDPSGYRFRRGPLGGMLDVPAGYFVCGLYDARSRRCLARANSEADVERVVDLGAMLSLDMIERRQAMMERIGASPAAPRRPYVRSSRVILVKGKEKSEVHELIACLEDVHEETLIETSCFDLELALERCTP